METEDEVIGAEWSVEGKYTEGVMDAYDISSKQLAAESGVHESTISRFFNDKKPIRDKQLLKLGIAIGRLAERKAKLKRIV